MKARTSETIDKPYGGGASLLAFSHRNQYLAAAIGQGITWWDRRSKKEVKTTTPAAQPLRDLLTHRLQSLASPEWLDAMHARWSIHVPVEVADAGLLTRRHAQRAFFTNVELLIATLTIAVVRGGIRASQVFGPIELSTRRYSAFISWKKDDRWCEGVAHPAISYFAAVLVR